MYLIQVSVIVSIKPTSEKETLGLLLSSAQRTPGINPLLFRLAFGWSGWSMAACAQQCWGCDAEGVILGSPQWCLGASRAASGGIWGEPINAEHLACFQHPKGRYSRPLDCLPAPRFSFDAFVEEDIKASRDFLLLAVPCPT